MTPITRREFLGATLCAAAATALPLRGASSAPARRMTIDLVCGAIGVRANQREAIDLAARHGFESVGADAGFLSALSAAELEDLKGGMKSRKLVFGAAGLPVEFRQGDEKFQKELKALPALADGLQRAGVNRVGTWLMPCSDDLPYMANFKQHAARLREVARVLKDRGQRLGLEYVGPKTLWASRRFPFVHTLPELRELIDEIGTGNTGCVLDSWHWWNAGDTLQDILALKPGDVVAVDLNDAPAGIPKDQQKDSQREIPCATGVINVGDFLTALNRIGYDGPVRAEPFNKKLNDMADDEACALVSASIKKAMAQISA